MAVASRQDGLDPVGATVGQRGGRVQAVVAELGGEKIDVIPWSDDPDVFVANALSPAQVVGVEIDEDERIASVTVPERMLSLAIGREGQNARLAAKLTGWRIDIRSETGEALPGEVMPLVEPGTSEDAVVAEPERGAGAGRGRGQPFQRMRPSLAATPSPRAMTLTPPKRKPKPRQHLPKRPRCRSSGRHGRQRAARS